MGVGRIKGITVEIGGDTTKLQTALKGVNTEIKNTQSQLKDVEKLLKLDPGNTELLSQKQKLLADAVSETKQKLETLKTAAEQANQALANGDISQEQYDALQREIVETEQELKRLEDQAKESGAALQEIAAKGEKLKDVGDTVSGVGEKFLPVTAAVTGLGAAAVKTASDFDSGMSKVAAISGATGDDLDALREKAREMGSKTKFSASEAASAMEYMAMAGWKTEDMLGGIEGIMNLAAASGEDLATTSDIVTDALTAFGLSAQDSGHFADILAAASSNANTNVSLMGETFKYCAPIAGALGFSAEDTAEAIGLMANAGIKGSQAGTALRTIMNNMAGPIDIAGEALGQVTIQTTNADGSMRDLSDILADCRVAFSQLSESEQATAAESLVGKNAMSGFLALMNAGEGDINKLSTAIANCDGKSAEMAETMQDNLAGQLTILKSQLEELAISFGEILMPVIRDIVGWIQGLADKLNSMDERTKKVITTIALVAAAVGPVLIIVGKIISAVGTIMTIVPKVASAIKAVKGVFAGLNAVMAANPIILIIAAIAALVAAFIYLWNNCEEFREFWINLWEKVKEIAVTVWNAIKDFFVNLWESITAIATTVWNGIKDFFTGLWDTIKSVAETVWNAIRDFFVGLWNGVSETATSIFTGISDFFSGLWTGISTAATTAWNGIIGFLSGAWEGISQTAQTIWNGVSGFFTGLWDTISTGVSTAWDGIKTGLSTTWDTISTTASNVWNGISGTVSTVTDGIATAVQGKWDNIKTAYDEHGGGMAGVASAALETIKGYYTVGWDAVNNITGGKLDAVEEKVTAVMESVKAWLAQAWTSIAQTAQTAWTSISAFFSSVWSAISNTVTSVVSSVAGFLGNAWNNIRSTISNVLSGILSAVTNAWSNIRNAVSNAMRTISTTVSSMWNSIRSGIANSISGILATIQTGFNNAVNFIRNLGSQAYTWGRDIIVGIINGIKSAIGTLTDSIRNIANSIRSFLHFSVPDEGPLADYESWMPDFMGGLAKGIEKSRGLVQKAIGDVSADMVVSPNVSGGASMTETINRSEQNGALVSLLGEYLPYLPKLAEMKMVTDTGALVGQLAPQMDERLGVMAMRQRRQ